MFQLKQNGKTENHKKIILIRAKSGNIAINKKLIKTFITL